MNFTIHQQGNENSSAFDRDEQRRLMGEEGSQSQTDMTVSKTFVSTSIMKRHREIIKFPMVKFKMLQLTINYEIMVCNYVSRCSPSLASPPSMI